MSNYVDLSLDDLIYEEYSDEEVTAFEEKGKSFLEKITERRESIKEKVLELNKENIKEAMYNELEIGEVVENEFGGIYDGRGFISTLSSSADYYALPLAFIDVGSSFKCFMTDRKFIIFELGSLYKIYRTYVIDYKDVDRVYVNEENNHIEFFAKKDKYNSIRECSNWLLYYFIQGRFAMSITSGEKEKIFKKFREKFKITKLMYYLWIMLGLFFIGFMIFLIIYIINNRVTT